MSKEQKTFQPPTESQRLYEQATAAEQAGNNEVATKLRKLAMQKAQEEANQQS